MPLSPGTRLGSYEIAAPLGAGGMGEDYRARDTKLERDVAIKILPSSLADDPDRRARFEREARLLASLNHPNIAHIYGLEDSGGVHALVMELVPGETLAEVIRAWGARPPASGKSAAAPDLATARPAARPKPEARGLGLDRALALARQICDALEAAHEKGIIHRDLKPSNVMVTPDGHVKLLDFGLGKLVEPELDSDPHNSPTITATSTHAGVLIGTAAYMSPEQAKGRGADKRSDVWAFGCVLYEMLTGTRAFAGDEVSDTLAAVLLREPEWTALPAGTPQSIHRVLRRCLERDRTQRLHDIGDARIELDEAMVEPVTAAGGPTPHSSRRAIALSWLTTLIVAAVATLLVSRAGQRAPNQPVARLELNYPADVEAAGGLAFSPDGTEIALVGYARGIRRVYIRRLDSYRLTAVPGTDSASGLFFSPDGRSIGVIVNNGILKRISLGDGLVQTLNRAVSFQGGGSWGEDDRITFVRESTLWQMSATSPGDARQLTRLDHGKGELSHTNPKSIDGGKAILFTVSTGSGKDAVHIEAVPVGTGERHFIVEGADPHYAASGHLIYSRDGALLAVPFDDKRLKVTGAPIHVLEDVRLVPEMSDSGSAVYLGGSALRQLVSVSRQGMEVPITRTPRSYSAPRLSADGHRVLVVANGDLWLQEIDRDTSTKLTTGATRDNDSPAWSRDEGRAIFRTATGLYSLAVNGSGQLDAIKDTLSTDYPNSISPAGDVLAFTRTSMDTASDVYVLSLQGEPHPHALVKTPGFDGGPQFSPDGRWLLYASNDAGNGEFQVFIRPFAGPDRSWLVAQTGNYPRWSRRGHEIVYRDGPKMMAVDMSTTGVDPVFSAPHVLFEQRYLFGYQTIANYDVSADGERFIMVKSEPGGDRLNVILNWTEELRRLAPEGAR